MAGEQPPSSMFRQQHQEIAYKSATPCDFVAAGGYYGNPVGGGMIFSPDSSSSPSHLVIDSTGLKHDTGLAVEWSIDEQHKLEEGLSKYANEPNIMRYVKIAASLRDKSVRDVALRCKWMGRKRRKAGDQNFVKKVSDMKEHFGGSSFKNSFSSAVSTNSFSSTTTHNGRRNSMLSGAISGASRHLLEENNRAFDQIAANLSSLKLQQNIDLFFRTKNNLTKILNNMRTTPGIMSQMPPLPIALNEELTNRIFPPLSQISDSDRWKL